MDEQTALMLQAVQAVLSETYQTVKQATENTTDEIDRKVVANWTEIQTLLSQRLSRELDAGMITEEQYDFAMDWLCNWMDYGPEEADVLLQAWMDWRQTS